MKTIKNLLLSILFGLIIVASSEVEAMLTRSGKTFATSSSVPTSSLAAQSTQDDEFFEGNGKGEKRKIVGSDDDEERRIRQRRPSLPTTGSTVVKVIDLTGDDEADKKGENNATAVELAKPLTVTQKIQGFCWSVYVRGLELYKAWIQDFLDDDQSNDDQSTVEQEFERITPKKPVPSVSLLDVVRQEVASSDYGAYPIIGLPCLGQFDVSKIHASKERMYCAPYALYHALSWLGGADFDDSYKRVLVRTTSDDKAWSLHRFFPVWENLMQDQYGHDLHDLHSEEIEYLMNKDIERDGSLKLLADNITIIDSLSDAKALVHGTMAREEIFARIRSLREQDRAQAILLNVGTDLGYAKRRSSHWICLCITQNFMIVFDSAHADQYGNLNDARYFAELCGLYDLYTTKDLRPLKHLSVLKPLFESAEGYLQRMRPGTEQRSELLTEVAGRLFEEFENWADRPFKVADKEVIFTKKAIDDKREEFKAPLGIDETRADYNQKFAGLIAELATYDCLKPLYQDMQKNPVFTLDKEVLSTAAYQHLGLAYGLALDEEISPDEFKNYALRAGIGRKFIENFLNTFTSLPAPASSGS